MYIYHHKTVDNTLSALDSRLEGKVLNLRYEIQDGGCFLLITGQAATETNTEELSAIHDEVKEFLSDKFPDRYGDYSWMVVISRGEEIVKTIFSNLLV